jgi:MFS family permease
MSKKTLQEISNYKDTVSTILSIFGGLSVLGLFASFIIFYKYFDLHNLQLHTPDNFIIAISVIWLLIYITLLFSLVVGWIIGAGVELQDYKELDKKVQKTVLTKLFVRNIIKITVFNLLLYAMIQYFNNDSNPIIITLLFILLSIVFFIIGIKYTYKYSKKTNVFLSFDYFIFLFISLFFYMFFIYEEKYAILPMMLFIPVLIIIYLLPFIFIESSEKTSMLKFVTIVYIALTTLFIMFMPTVFIESTMKELHLGNIYYKKLTLQKDECSRLKNYNLGYKCDENNTLSNMMGLWISNEKPIFQKADTSSIKVKAEDNSTKIWLHRDKIYTVL